MILLLIIIIIAFVCYVVHTERRIAAIKRANRVAEVQQYVDGVDAERNRLGMDLHDGIANDLLAIEMKLSARSDGGDYEWIVKDIAGVRNCVRNVSHELIPPEFARLGLDEVLSCYVSDFAASNGAKVELTTDNSLGVGKVDEKTALEVFRIIQELLSNILKHSQASSVIIDIRSLTPKVASVSIVDDGIEWPGNVVGLGLGIKTVADRITSIGAKIEYKRFTNQNIKRITFEK
jgi:signal transduction histidine kinase